MSGRNSKDLGDMLAVAKIETDECEIVRLSTSVREGESVRKSACFKG